MIKATTTIRNAHGIHFRPAEVLASAMRHYDSDISVIANGKHCNCKSIDDILSAGIQQGTSIEIDCDGHDENDALAEAINIINTGFGERTIA